MVYRDVVRVLRAMPWLACVALLVLLATSTADFVIARYVPLGPITQFLKEASLRVAESFFLTPILIAVHRFIILDQRTERYVIEPRHPRFERFFVWSLLIWVFTASMSYVVLPLARVDSSLMTSFTITLIAFGAIVFVSLRLTILFPAIAVDAPGATVSNAFADSQGHVLGILFISLVATIPVAAYIFIVGTLLASTKAATGLRAESYVVVVLGASAQLIGYVLLVAMASRVFQALADRVLRAPAAG
jgi:hypothetical protein